ncbi:MAG: phosphate signaling complex protein PhoU [Pirellulales bacterium]|nr:phosphate signaling complex protein PhoU [Pirellulales bacterium]
MSLHLQRELERLKKHLLSLCAVVEDHVHKAVRSLLDRDPRLADEVERGDDDVDRREIEVEEDCLKILALYQPVAIDLRTIVAVMKINNDLERIGDLAVNISRKAAAFIAEPAAEIPIDLELMWEKAQGMLRDSVNSLIDMKVELAKDVCRRDAEVDRMKHDNRKAIEDLICNNPALVRPLMRILAVSRNLERIADCATNIAEDVIYIVEGKIVRHHEE